MSYPINKLRCQRFMKLPIKFYFLIICLFLAGIASGLTSRSSQDFYQGHSPGILGESGHQFIGPDGLFIHPHYNDFLGRTDKYLTGGSIIGIKKKWERSAIEWKSSWRLITPNFDPQYRPVSSQKNKFADWIENRVAYAYILPQFFSDTIDVKIQPYLGFGYIGNNGGKQTHRFVHQITGNSTEFLTYNNQPKGMTTSYGAESSLIFPQQSFGSLFKHQTQLTLGFSNSQLMVESYLAFHQIFSFNHHFKLAQQLSFSRQYSSQIFTSIKNDRFEAGLSLLLFHSFKPGIRYVSSFLKEDPVPQLFIDPLAFYLPI